MQLDGRFRGPPCAAITAVLGRPENSNLKESLTTERASSGGPGEVSWERPGLTIRLVALVEGSSGLESVGLRL